MTVDSSVANITIAQNAHISDLNLSIKDESDINDKLGATMRSHQRERKLSEEEKEALPTVAELDEFEKMLTDAAKTNSSESPESKKTASAEKKKNPFAPSPRRDSTLAEEIMKID